MIALDTNLLVYSHREDSAFHGQARELVAAGATEMVIGVPAGLGPRALEDAHRDVLGPLRAEHG